MDGWEDVAVVVGGAAAALIGAFFVAVSIKIDVIGRSMDLRNRAAQTLVLFISPLVAAVLLVVPEQPTVALGIELIALGVIAGAAAFVLDQRAKRHRDGVTISRTLEIVTPNAITSVLTGVAGLVLVVGHQAGFYLLVPAFLAAITGGVINAWLFLAKITD